MKILVGFSGGVDSAVAAYLLKKQGHDVSGAFMRNWDAFANNDFLGNPTINDNQCPQEKDYDDAVIAANKIGIELLRVDFVKEYWDKVFSHFLKEYEEGRTPNPDLFCNKHIKFDSFLKFAKDNGFDMIAMGHYAGRVTVDGVNYIKKALDFSKDQSYFLSQINEEQISSCIFPLSDITKKDVREIARSLNLNIADKKDSTGVCFIGERNFKEFLMNYLPSKDGDIVDIETNKKIGRHVGVLYYTIGQRKGLGIGGIHGEDATGWFVCKKDVKKNILYVARRNAEKYLYSDRIIVKKLNMVKPYFEGIIPVGAKFRYRQPDNFVKIHYLNKDTIEVICDTPIKAVTPGQAAVFYEGDVMIGGGIIAETYYKDKKIN